MKDTPTVGGGGSVDFSYRGTGIFCRAAQVWQEEETLSIALEFVIEKSPIELSNGPRDESGIKESPIELLNGPHGESGVEKSSPRCEMV